MDRVIRFLLFLLGTLTRKGQRSGRPPGTWLWIRTAGKNLAACTPIPDGPAIGDTWPGGPRPLPPWHSHGARTADPERPGGKGGGTGRRRRRIPLRVKGAAAVVSVG